MFQPTDTATLAENRGDATGTSRGTTVTASATPDTKGTWVALGSATSFAYNTLTIIIGRVSAAANIMVDIGLDNGASNTFILVPDLPVQSRNLNEHELSITLPLHVPSSSLLYARSTSTSASTLCDVLVIGHSAGLGGGPGFSRAINLFTPASSRGVALDPGGVADSEGSWTQMISSCPADLGGMYGFFDNGGDTARGGTSQNTVDIGIGQSGNESPIYQNALVGVGATRDGASVCPKIPPFSCHVQNGTRIAARTACTITTAGDRTVGLCLYGLVL